MNRLNGIIGVVVSSVAVLVVVLVGWFFFVSPQRSKADTLSTQVNSARGELASDEQLIATAKKQNTLGNAKAAERALPDTPRVSEILRELTALAAAVADRARQHCARCADAVRRPRRRCRSP